MVSSEAKGTLAALRRERVDVLEVNFSESHKHAIARLS